MNKNQALERIRIILSGFEEIDLAYVFGSFLERDDFHDIDVAIRLSKEQSPYQRFKLSQRVGRELEKGVEPRVAFDVRILNYAPAYSQYEVIAKG
jgi:predicted nucleotidyltransferase